mmetsp:Transcript_64440/g.151790  ORF Transcript_64440/g.151790 Transcript_64440/m.151790 type:complete len:377 (+) Transcript_64440:35-1165(+)
MHTKVVMIKQPRQVLLLATVGVCLLSATNAFLSPLGFRVREGQVAKGNVAPFLRGARMQPQCRTCKLRSPRMSSGLSGNGEEEEFQRELRGELVGMPLFRSDNGTRDEEFGGLSSFTGSKKAEKYIQLVASLTPAETVGQFMDTAPPRVQSAMRETILSLFGSLGDTPAFDASVVTTKRAMGSLFFQMEMTGYLFRNAEYRKSLERSINMALLEGSASKSDDDDKVVQGNITLKSEGDGSEVSVDAGRYISDLKREVEQLRAEMAAMKQKELEADESASVVQYIQKLSGEEIKKLSENISPEVVEAMQHLVKLVTKSMAGPELPPMLSAVLGGAQADVVTEVPSNVLAQLCMWQLVVGYNLREIEARDAFKEQLDK